MTRSTLTLTPILGAVERGGLTPDGLTSGTLTLRTVAQDRDPGA